LIGPYVTVVIPGLIVALAPSMTPFHPSCAGLARLPAVIASVSEAIQSVHDGPILDCFVAFAPVRKRFSKPLKPLRREGRMFR
jgi:hypothetical protein